MSVGVAKPQNFPLCGAQIQVCKMKIRHSINRTYNMVFLLKLPNGNNSEIVEHVRKNKSISFLRELAYVVS